jgi:hypothetical protein
MHDDSVPSSAAVSSSQQQSAAVSSQNFNRPVDLSPLLAAGTATKYEN